MSVKLKLFEHNDEAVVISLAGSYDSVSYIRDELFLALPHHVQAVNHRNLQYPFFNPLLSTTLPSIHIILPKPTTDMPLKRTISLLRGILETTLGHPTGHIQSTLLEAPTALPEISAFRDGDMATKMGMMRGVIINNTQGDTGVQELEGEMTEEADPLEDYPRISKPKPWGPINEVNIHWKDLYLFPGDN